MQLVEQHIIGKNHEFWNECDRLCFASKNLYNVALYTIKKRYEETGEYLNYHAINKLFTQNNQVDYRNLPSKVSQQTLMLLDKNYKSFFKLLKVKSKLKGNPQSPRFKHKTKGRNIVIYTNPALSKMEFKRTGLIGLTMSSIKINSKIMNNCGNKYK